MKVHYLEIVSPDVDSICELYEASQNVRFGAADESLGGARTCTLSDGSLVGVRGPLRETEEPVVRPYWLVQDIETALEEAVAQGAEVAHPPMELAGKGTFAIFILGSVDQGLWQL